MIHTLINCTCKIDLVSLYFRLLWYHSTLKVQLFSLAWLPWFPDLSRPYGACVKLRGGETYIWSQSLSSESAVKYPHIGRRKIQISSPPGGQDQSNALPQGQQRQSNPHAMPLLPHPPFPAGFTMIDAESDLRRIHVNCLKLIFMKRANVTKR